MAAVILLEDIEAVADGIHLQSRLDALTPAVVRLSFGRSGLDRAVLALRLVDALLARYPTSHFSIAGLPSVRRLLSGHLRASGARLTSAPPSLVVDVAPGVRRRSEWVDVEPPVLRIASVPYPGRRQHAAEHWLDAARAAGLTPVRGTPRLNIPRTSLRAARQLLGEIAPRKPVVILAPNRDGWSAASYLGLAHQLDTRMGARVVTLRPIDGIQRLDHQDPLLIAAAARLASAVVGDAGGFCDVAAASGAAVVALHGRASPGRC